MAIINEIQMGAVPSLNGMTMFRKYDGERGFEPYFKFIDDNTLAMDSNIVVNYIEFYKNSLGVIIKELTKYKYYVVPNIAAIIYAVGEIITPAVLYIAGELMTDNTLAIGGETKTIAVLATGVEVKKVAWLGANRWFLSVSRTPMTAPYGIMDGIEATLSGLPTDIPNGYILKGSL